MTTLSEVGKGALGVGGRRKSFSDLLDESGTRKDAICILKPVREILSDWSVDSGNTYVTGYEFNFDNIRRDVVGVRTEDESLTRADTLALCRSTPGTFFYNVDEEFPSGAAKWDDASYKWQIPTHQFDGSTYGVWNSTPEGIVDGKEGTVSLWIKLPENYPGASSVILANNGDIRFVVYIFTGLIVVVGQNSAGTNILIGNGSTDLRDGLWHHVGMSWNLATASIQILLDGVDDLAGGGTLTNDTIDYATGAWSYGAYSSGSFITANGAVIGQLWFDTTEQDVSDGNFYDSAVGHIPKEFNLDGTIDGSVTVRPKIFLYDSADAGSPKINYGTGGDIDTITGTFQQGDTTPNHPNGAILWDQFSKLYVHLTDTTDPSSNTLVAVHYFPFATEGVSHPHLGDDLLTDGIFENWDSVITPSDWTPNIPGGTAMSIVREEISVKEGTYSLSFIANGTEDVVFVSVYQDLALITGGYYRLSGWYKWEPDDDNDNASFTMRPQVTIKHDTNGVTLQSDGRNTRDIFNTFRLDGSSPTPNKWFRWFYDFRAPSNIVPGRLYMFGYTDPGAKGKIIYDGIQLKRIWSWDHHDPRLSDTSIPNIDTGSRDIFFGGKEIGNGSIELINSEGKLERLIGECEWMNTECIVDIGGKWDIENTEVPRDNYFRGFTGLIQGVDVNDDVATFDVQDQRAFFHIDLPPRYYDDNDFPNMDTKNFQGKPRPIWFGAKENITPARIDNGSSSDYGKYELADTNRAPNGIKLISKVYAYIDETAAGLKRTDQRIDLTSGTDYTEDLANGQFTIISDVGPYVIDDTNNYLDFNEGGAELNAVLTLGLYTADDLVAEIETQMEAAGANGYTVTYSDTTHKVTIASGGATMNLLCKTGTNKEISIWDKIGFKKNANRTTLTEVGDNATFSSADSDHVLRVNGTGFKDDASGTYTGTANALIEVGADALRVILLKYMVKPSSIIDSASFLLARSRGAESLSLYSNETLSTRDMFEYLEYSNIANIIINGEGKVFYNIYVGDIPDNITLVHDRDFQSFSSGKQTAEVFTTIRVLFDKDPTLGKHRARETTDNGVRVRLGRPDTKEFITLLKLADSAINCSVRYSVLSSSAARKVTGVVLGSKMMNLEVGDKIKITRRRAIALGGEIVNRVFRILSLSKNPLSGTVDFTATDDKVTVANQACIGTCQHFCKGGNCQDTCEQSCQEACKRPGNCQDLCEGTCQGDPCQQVDQECVINCQDACKLGNCQTVCMIATQDCGGCQTYCETGPCQDACQLVPCQTCQNPCQAGSVCMTDCEEGVTCQDSCQKGETCEDPCQEPGNCKDTCELTPCQSGCQAGSCESYCETAVCQQAEEQAI